MYYAKLIFVKNEYSEYASICLHFHAFSEPIIKPRITANLRPITCINLPTPPPLSSSSLFIQDYSAGHGSRPIVVQSRAHIFPR